MARYHPRSAGSWDERERLEALSASRAVLVVARHPAPLAEALQDRGLPATFAKTARAAVWWVRQHPPALILLDLDVERASFLLRQFRAEGRSIVAMSDDTNARSRALEAGCIDATASAIPLDELSLKIARVVHDRRVQRSGAITIPPLVVDLSARRLVWDGRPVSASGVLVDFASCLALRPGQIVATREILEQVWGEPWATTDRVHRTAWRLRRILDLSRASPFFVAKWREGYGFFPEQPVSTHGARAVR